MIKQMQLHIPSLLTLVVLYHCLGCTPHYLCLQILSHQHMHRWLFSSRSDQQ